MSTSELETPHLPARYGLVDRMAAGLEDGRALHRRLPMELLDDGERRALETRQLRELPVLGILERPNDPVPCSIGQLTELLTR